MTIYALNWSEVKFLCLLRFQPDNRVDKARSREVGGVGLGLALCREIAQIHGAVLHLESVPGTGTEAILEIKGRVVKANA